MPDLPPLSLVPPAGYGFSRAPVLSIPDDLYDGLLVWELPRSSHLYVVSVDVGDGIGQDRSVVDVTRVGTLAEPDEQVAQFVSAFIDPAALAPLVDAIGRFYTGKDGQEAIVAVEINNHGLVTQSELQMHLGYSNFWIWQYYDKLDAERSLSSSIGWATTPRTRPMILARYLRAVKNVDPNTNLPDYIVNSPLTLQELRSFQTEGGIREAEADPSDPSAHDDCVMAGAIGVWVSWTLQAGETEPLDQARRRVAEEKVRKAEDDRRHAEHRDFINQDFTAEEAGMSRSPYGYGEGEEDPYWTPS